MPKNAVFGAVPFFFVVIQFLLTFFINIEEPIQAFDVGFERAGHFAGFFFLKANQFIITPIITRLTQGDNSLTWLFEMKLLTSLTQESLKILPVGFSIIVANCPIFTL
ncbi:hypothetical protein GC194_06040 [bacterium]|nr:hypothetical protein [bacterium]